MPPAPLAETDRAFGADNPDPPNCLLIWVPSHKEKHLPTPVIISTKFLQYTTNFKFCSNLVFYLIDSWAPAGHVGPGPRFALIRHFEGPM